METVNESIYDHPKYYDLVFGTDCAAELKFIEGVHQRFLKGKARQLFEPACGTGRLMYRLAKKGYSIEGIDLNAKAVEFSNQRFVRHGLKPAAFVADMSDFKAKKKFDLAFNTINSFRHLTKPADATAHLRCMAESGKRNSVYLIGLHLSPTDGDTCDEESWFARRGHLATLTHMWTEDRDEKKRLDRFGIQFNIYTPTKQFQIVDELQMRSYSAKQFQKFVDAEGSWEIEETYDFTYDIDDPIVIGPETEDVVYVLRRK